MRLFKLSNRILAKFLLANILLIIAGGFFVLVWLPLKFESLAISSVTDNSLAVARQMVNQQQFEPPSSLDAIPTDIIINRYPPFNEQQLDEGSTVQRAWKQLASTPERAFIESFQSDTGERFLRIAIADNLSGRRGMLMMSVPLSPGLDSAHSLSDQIQKIMLLIFFLLTAVTCWMYYHINVRLDKLLKDSETTSGSEYPPGEPTTGLSNDSADKFNRLTMGIQSFKTQLSSSRADLSHCQLTYRELSRELALLNLELEKTSAKQALSVQQHIEQVRELQHYPNADQQGPILHQLITGVSHDITTPLDVSLSHSHRVLKNIATFKQSLASGFISVDATKQFIDQLNTNINIVITNLDRTSWLLHAFSHLAADPVDDQASHINLKLYLGELAVSLEPMLKQRQLQLSVQVEHGLTLYSYHKYLNQIITNLIVNSIKHGFVERQQGIISLTVSSYERGVIFDYRDSGCIDSEGQRMQLLTPLRKAKPDDIGKGLGLSIVWRLVNEQLGGNIELYHPSPREVGYRLKIPNLSPKG